MKHYYPAERIIHELPATTTRKVFTFLASAVREAQESGEKLFTPGSIAAHTTVKLANRYKVEVKIIARVDSIWRLSKDGVYRFVGNINMLARHSHHSERFFWGDMGADTRTQLLTAAAEALEKEIDNLISEQATSEKVEALYAERYEREVVEHVPSFSKLARRTEQLAQQLDREAEKLTKAADTLRESLTARSHAELAHALNRLSVTRALNLVCSHDNHELAGIKNGLAAVELLETKLHDDIKRELKGNE